VEAVKVWLLFVNVLIDMSEREDGERGTKPLSLLIG